LYRQLDPLLLQPDNIPQIPVFNPIGPGRQSCQPGSLPGSAPAG
jgi:hypothetical protein